MCGRYSITLPVEAVRRYFQVPQLPNLEPRYNVAPTQDAPIVRLDREGNRELAMLRWGLIPWWAKDAKLGNKLINARAESVAGNSSFRDAFQRRRCLVAADGFYEWRKVGKERRPYRIARTDGELLAMAGLWDRWKAPGGERVESFTIVTTDANDLVLPLHDRMPVIIGPADFDAWLAEPRTELLRPYPGELLTAYPVSQRVNSPKNDDPECLTRIPE